MDLNLLCYKFITHNSHSNTIELHDNINQVFLCIVNNYLSLIRKHWRYIHSLNYKLSTYIEQKVKFLKLTANVITGVFKSLIPEKSPRIESNLLGLLGLSGGFELESDPFVLAVDVITNVVMITIPKIISKI